MLREKSAINIQCPLQSWLQWDWNIFLSDQRSLQEVDTAEDHQGYQAR